MDVAAGGGLVGRDGELAVLRGLVADLVAGRGGVVWVQGEPGIGKSALVDTGLAGAPASGVRLFRAAADELTQSFALRLAADCLAVTAPAADEHRAEIVELLAGRGAVVDAVSAAAERLLALVDRECARSPVVLFGDDLQWADEASLGVWYRLVAAAGQQPLLLVGVCRPVPRRAEVDRLRQAIQQHPDAVALDLDPLTPDQVTAMAHHALSAPPGPQLIGLLHQAAGNPLYVREVLDTLIRDRSVRVEHGRADLTTPVGELSLSAAIGRRLGFLPEAVRTTLRTASILDNRFTVDDWALVTDQTVPQLITVIDEALTAGVLAAADTALTFRHPLIRQALHDELPAPVRTGLHAYAAQTLAQAGRSWDRVARHLLAAPDAVDGWALDWLAEVPTEAVYAQPTTSAHLLEAARQVTVTGDPRRALITTRLTTVLRLLQRYDDLIRVGTEALATVTDPFLVGEIASNLARGYSLAHRDDEAAALITQVLDGPDVGVPWRSRLRAQLAQSLFYDNQDSQSRLQAEQAIAEGERDGDPVSIGWTLNTMALAHTGTDAVTLFDRALQVVVGDDPESADLRLKILIGRVMDLYNLNRTAEWKAELHHAIALAERGGSPRQTQIKGYAAGLFQDQGDWDQALLYVDQIMDAPNMSPIDRANTAEVAARIALCRGDPATAERHLAAMDSLPFTSSVQRHHADGLILVAALLTEADGQLERGVSMLAERLDPQHPAWHNDDFLADVVRLALAAGDPATAETAARIAEAAAEPALPITFGICRAMLVDDPAALLKAAGHLETAGRRPFRAFTLQEAAVRLAQRGDIAPARAAFATAVAIYDDLGSILDLRRIQARLRPYGIRRGSRSAHRRVLVGWEALTPAERTVAALVSRGDSNPEIATQLVLSRRTVEVHIGHILHKLQVRSRVEIAHEVTRHQPTTGSHHPHRPDDPDQSERH